MRRQDARATVYYRLPRGDRAMLELRTARGTLLHRTRVAGGKGVHRRAWRLPLHNGRYVVALRAGARELRRTLRVKAAPSPPARRPPRREPHSLADAQQNETGAVSGEELEAEAASARAAKPGGPVSTNGVTLFDPKDPVRSVDNGATITYQLTAPAQSVSLAVLDRRGRTVRTLTGLPVDAGVHNVTWNLRFTGPVSYPGLVFWAASPTAGPKAPLGKYTVRLQADSTKLSQDLQILKDPRLTSISAGDIEEQYRLGAIVSNDVRAFNDLLASKGQAPIACQSGSA